MAVASYMGSAGSVVVIPPHAILREGIRGLKGSDPVFANTSACANEFKYTISFHLPASSGVNGLAKVVADGGVFRSRYDAEISAVQSVLMKLYKEHGYIIEDYSSIRGNICRLRYRDFIHKVDESKARYKEIKASYQNVMKEIILVSDMFASIACSPDHFKVNEGCVATLMSCSEEFQRIGSRGMEEMDRLDRRVQSVLSRVVGNSSSSVAVVTEQVDKTVEVKDALRVVLNEVAKTLGFDEPVFKVNGSEESHYQIRTVTMKRLDGDEVAVEGIGVSASRKRCEYNAICDALLLLETKFHVVIKEVNHSYYSTMFGRVKEMENSLDVISSNCKEISKSVDSIISAVAYNEHSNHMLIYHPELGGTCTKWFHMVKEMLENYQKSIEPKIVEASQNARIGTIKF